MASIRQNCRKVVCIGRNYADHITELSSARPKQPFYFLKPPSSILPAHTSLSQSSSSPKPTLLIPAGINLHYEVELGFTIKTPHGKPLKNLPNQPSIMAEVIGSWLLGIDMTARNVQDEAKRKGLPWSIAKGFDTFLPISNAFPFAALGPDPHAEAVTLALAVNGVTKQDDSTALMLFQIPRLLSDVSKVMSLEDGDVLLTGTPKGVGPVQAGDVMTAGIKVDGKEIEEGRIEVLVADAEAGENAYRFEET